MIPQVMGFLRLQVPMEAHFLDESLGSLRPVVDELVIIDSGENTYADEYAAKHGARVVRVPWTGNYSDVANVMLAESRGKWMLWMDADEFFLEGADLVRDIVERDLPRWTTVRTIHFEDPVSTFEEPRSLRLLPSLEGLSFSGVYDPELAAPSLSTAAFDSCLLDSDIKIAHRAYQYNEVIVQKNRRWAAMRYRELESDPTNRPARQKLASYLIASRDWADALRELQTLIDTADAGDQQLPVLLLRASTCALSLGNPDRALAAARQALSVEPRFSDAYYMIGTALLKQGDLDGAEAAMQQALALRDQAPFFYLIDKSMSGWKPLADLAEICRLRGQPEQALSFVYASLKEYPTNYRAYLQIAAVQKQLGHRSDALSAYEKAIELNPQLAVRRASAPAPTHS